MPDPIRIDIPDAKPVPVTQVAGAIVIAALREAGLDPRKPATINNPMLRTMLGMWGRNEMTRAEFVETAKRIAWINPATALEGGTDATR